SPQSCRRSCSRPGRRSARRRPLASQRSGELRRRGHRRCRVDLTRQRQENKPMYRFGVLVAALGGALIIAAGAAAHAELSPSDTPAPQVEFKSSLGGGGSNTLAIVALVVGVVALVVAFITLFTGGGRRAVA